MSASAARGRLGVVAGSSLAGAEPPAGEWEVLQRHGSLARHVLPHEVDHVANMGTLRDAGCDRVLAVASVGGLRAELGPGTLVCPDDFIALDALPVTALAGVAAHRVPGFDPDWRAEVLGALGEAEAEVVDGGVYWQVAGPRLETKAEIRFVAEHAEVIGMTVGSECVVAGELGLAYAAICVVDNLANGIAATELTLEEVTAAQAAHREGVERLLAEVLPALA